MTQLSVFDNRITLDDVSKKFVQKFLTLFPPIS